MKLYNLLKKLKNIKLFNNLIIKYHIIYNLCVYIIYDIF